MPKFFIDRPIFAWVLSLLIMLGGVLAITHLPVAQYPTVAPPSIAINANYAGASAETVQDTVTSVIEQQMNGIDNLLYMSSSSSASGQSTVTLYFNSGTDPDIAQVQVQNKLQLAMPNLPQTVQQQGITVVKSTRNFLMFFALSSTNKDVSDIAQINARTVGIHPQQNIFKLLHRGQRALALQGDVDFLSLHRRAVSELPHRHLHVLRLNRGDDVVGGEVVAFELVGLQPDAHGVFGAEQIRLAHAGDAAERIEHGR